MRVPFLLSLLPLATFSIASPVQEGVIISGKDELPFSSNTPVLFNDSTDELSIKFKLDTPKQPDQIFIKLSDSNGIETSFKPITRLTNGAFVSKLTIPYSRLPKLFTSEQELNINLIIADFDESFTKINTQIGSIHLSDSLIAQSNYKKPIKFEHKPEIHHIFNQPPKTVNPVIALFFSGLSIALLFALVIVWVSLGVVDFKNFPGFNVSHLSLIGLIFAYEVVFFQYYLGSSIFQTIFKSLVLLAPTVWFGSNVLNYVGGLRLAGKR